MRVSLAQPHDARRLQSRVATTADALPLARPSGARVVLGGAVDAAGLARPIAPAAGTLFGPRGALLVRPGGPLVVCDTGHHRLLIWRRAPDADDAPADILIGQPGFDREGRNAKGDAGAVTLNVPTGVASDGRSLVVADAWNHRVLIWHDIPACSHRPADLVLGQADFDRTAPNRGGAPAADTLYWCYGVAFVGGSLAVADSGNRRVLLWERLPERNGQPADLVLGQAGFDCRDENAGEGGGPRGMRWPHAVATAAGALFVADAGDNRIMAWDHIPGMNGAACDFVLGQRDRSGIDHNQGAYWPTAASLNMPYGLAVSGDLLVAADTANSRLLGWPLHALAEGAPAKRLAGQPDFTAKGDNRWGAPARNSLCWPYGIDTCGKTLVIADSGNNRVLLWERADD